MQTFYHLSYTSHDEVMYRNAEDMRHAFLSLCLALHQTQSRCLAEVFLTTHHHGAYLTDHPTALIRQSRLSYTQYFNARYHRKGPLGDPGCFVHVLEGLRHQIAALSYIIKNPVHHGITGMPFEYPYGSANSYFRKELGKDTSPSALLSVSEIQRSIPRHASFNPSWKMGPDNAFLRESVLETAIVENMYSTPQAYLFMVTRKSGEDWYKEQEKDGNHEPPVTLEVMESAMEREEEYPQKYISEMLRNERKRFDSLRQTDLDLCNVIDLEYLPRFGVSSVYLLRNEQKNRLANTLYDSFHVSVRQIRRCLAMNEKE